MSVLVLAFIVANFSLAKSFETESLFYSLEKIVSYLDKNYFKLNSDCLLGAIISKENFMSINTLNSEETQIKTEFLSNFTKRLIDKWVLFLKLRESNDRATKIIELIMKNQVFRKELIYEKVLTNETCNETLGNKINMSDSDTCLENILSAQNARDVNAFCWKKYVESSLARNGYKGGHLLLHADIAFAKGLLSYESYRLKAIKICSCIYHELERMVEKDRLFEGFDLFMENVVLCGREGFGEFFKLDWLEIVLRSQREEGCFGGFERRIRKKRNWNILDDGCVDHTTGVAFSFLSLYYNYINNLMV